MIRRHFLRWVIHSTTDQHDHVLSVEGYIWSKMNVVAGHCTCKLYQVVLMRNIKLDL